MNGDWWLLCLLFSCSCFGKRRGKVESAGTGRRMTRGLSRVRERKTMRGV